MGDIELFKSIAHRVIERGEAISDTTPTQFRTLQLPLWPDSGRAAPSGMLRSALFRVTSKDPSKAVWQNLVASWPGWEIKFSGLPLSQTDLDVWLEIIDLAKSCPSYPNIHTKTLAFLKRMGRKPGGRDVQWLIKVLEKLEGVSINIKGKDFGTYQSGLIHKVVIPEDTDSHVKIELNPELAKLFDDGYTVLRSIERRKLRGNLAKWLHGYVSSHEATQKKPSKISLEKLSNLSGSDRSVMKFFKHDVKKSMEQLKRIGAIEDFYFKDNILVFEKPGTRKKLSKRV